MDEQQVGVQWDGSFIVLLAFLILMILVVGVGLLISRRKEDKEYTNAVIGFCSIGAMVGVITGLSKTPIAGSVVSATLVFLGGIVAYLFTTEKVNKDAQKIIGNLLAGFGILLICGIFIGASLRTGNVLGADQAPDTDQDANSGQVTDQSEDPQESNGYLWLEGKDDEIAVQIETLADLPYVQIEDTTRGLAYELTANPTALRNVKTTWMAENLKVRWPADSSFQDPGQCLALLTYKWAPVDEPNAEWTDPAPGDIEITEQEPKECVATISG